MRQTYVRLFKLEILSSRVVSTCEKLHRGSDWCKHWICIARQVSFVNIHVTCNLMIGYAGWIRNLYVVHVFRFDGWRHYHACWIASLSCVLTLIERIFFYQDVFLYSFLQLCCLVCFWLILFLYIPQTVLALRGPGGEMNSL